MIAHRSIRRAATGSVLGLVALLLLAPAPIADAFIYWGDFTNGSIGRADNDGSNVNPNLITGGSAVRGVAVDARHIYWANEFGDSIGRANIDGTGVNQKFISGINDPSGIAVTGSYIFWSSAPAFAVGRANIDGSNPQPELVAGIPEPCGVAVDGGHVYWTDKEGSPSYIGRASLSGLLTNEKFVTIPGTSLPCGVAVNTQYVFWTDTGFATGTNIGRANINGGEADASLIGDAAGPCGIAVFGSQIYWANAAIKTIGRANTDSSGVNQSFVATGGSFPCGVAVDALSSPPPPGPEPPAPVADSSPPQTKISRGPGRKLAQGIAKFSFSSSEPGSTFTCRLDRGKPKRCRSPRRYKHLRHGRHVFKVWATDAAGNKDPTPAKRSFKVPRA